MFENGKTEVHGNMSGKETFFIEDLFLLPKKLARTTRWSRWVDQGAEVEDVLSHTFTQSFLVILIVEILRNQRDFDASQAYEALACTVIHDIGEAETGDILDYKKTKTHEEEERRIVHSYISKIEPGNKNSLMFLYDIQNGAKDDQTVHEQRLATVIFGLAEKLCYLAYAVRQAYQSEGAAYGSSVLEHVVERQIHGVRIRLARLGLSEANFPVIEWAEKLSRQQRKG